MHRIVFLLKPISFESILRQPEYESYRISGGYRCVPSGVILNRRRPIMLVGTFGCESDWWRCKSNVQTYGRHEPQVFVEECFHFIGKYCKRIKQGTLKLRLLEARHKQASIKNSKNPNADLQLDKYPPKPRHEFKLHFMEWNQIQREVTHNFEDNEQHTPNEKPDKRVICHNYLPNRPAKGPTKKYNSQLKYAYFETWLKSTIDKHFLFLK